MDDWDYSAPVYSSYSTKELSTKNLYKLAAHRRAIANFVSIVTGQSIPVKFSTKGDSYTDGKVVTISANIAEPKEFDPAVGLALHEGSHIKLSNFDILRDLEMVIIRIIGSEEYKRLDEISNQKGVTYFAGVVKDILNYVEDRRIDNFIYKSAPGYRDYYRSMYDKYFNDPAIDRGMKSDEFTEENFESYMFRLINLHSKFSKPNALKRMPEIARIIKLNEISRLKTTEDALKIALEVYAILIDAIEPLTPQQQQKGQGQGSGNGQAGEGEQEAGEDDIEVDMSGDDGDSGDGSGDDGSDDGDNDMSGDSNEPAEDGKGVKGKIVIKPGKGNGKPAEGRLSQRQIDIIRKKIEKQKEFLRGKIKKTKVSSTEAKQLESIEEAGAEMKVVAQDYYGNGNSFKGIECVVVKKMTRNLMEQDNFPLTSKRYNKTEDTMYDQYSKEVAEGIRIGTLLGKKMQVRGESRETIFNRQLVGKMDKRMVSSLGYGNEHVFYTREVDMFKKANLHISVDASGSMGGEKWRKTMTNIVALAKAVDMIPNLNIQISFRTTTGELPYIVLAYDSRVDKFMKVKQLFGYLHPNGTTPEGLCFEAVMKQMVGSNGEVDSYFLNISDGEPYFHGKGMSYSGSNAAKHTRKMMKSIESMGIKVLSYFVSDSSYEMDENSSGSARTFKECYGPAASYINVTNVNEVARTMNRLFMSKPQNS
jgi:hypothetical protein